MGLKRKLHTYTQAFRLTERRVRRSDVSTMHAVRSSWSRQSAVVTFWSTRIHREGNEREDLSRSLEQQSGATAEHGASGGLHSNSVRRCATGWIGTRWVGLKSAHFEY